MDLIRSLFRRRQFLFAVMGAAMAQSFRRIAGIFDLIFQTDPAKAFETPESGGRKPHKAIVVYYSATGSTAKVAGAIHKGMKSVIACDIAPIKKVMPEDMAGYDLIAVGAPNWYHREPANVKMFTNHMPRMDGKHCILFCTHGEAPTGQFWSMSRNILKKGMTIIGWNDWYGDSTHVLHALQPYGTHGHPDRIDLMEAEAFGREMAECSMRIYAGEKALIPEIPQREYADIMSPALARGEVKLDNWTPEVVGNVEERTTNDTSMDVTPKFDPTKCVYPRCTECLDLCPVDAIDLSILTSAGSADTPIIKKEACIVPACRGLCKRVCFYDAISYAEETDRTIHEIDITKCIYPKCTLCIDECPMDCIDFSQNPPLVHEHCEGCDVCWCICPVDGASIITNWVTSQFRHIPRSLMPEDVIKKFNLPPEKDPRRAQMTIQELYKLPEIPGVERKETATKFRKLVSDEEYGTRGFPAFAPAPRIVIDKAEWPYEMNEGQEV